MTMRVLQGLPHPLGATWDGSGVNFALFSANAARVQLCLFDRQGRREIERVDMPEQTHEVWHGYLPDVRPGQLYGYRVHGPYAPEEGHRFNANKLLIDPYAKALHGDLRWHDACFGYRVGSSREDLSFDRRDSAFVMPKCVVTDPAYTWGEDIRPRRGWAETIIYEAHVKGMTAAHPDLPDHLRGTFAGLADPLVIEHLEKQGVTAIELMPVQSFFDDRMLVDKGLTNYWGYNTVCFHAPATRYISPGHGVDEFKFMVKRLHEAGIEVILDVVYNHTAEGNEMGPTLSFRGIDNANYYLLAEDPRHYFDTTGTGNTMNLRHPRVLQMVTDSLRYWVEECHVDGFRFDLTVALGREYDQFDPSAIFFDVLAQDPVLQDVKLIAEPWDVGPDGYQLGNFPPGWAEWNGAYRDGVRSYWKGDAGTLPGLASSLLGSADRFDHRGRRTWASVNFVTAHDGFTLMDLWSYNEKHNEANLEDNRDGHDDNRSWNGGVEGPTDDPDVLALRGRLRRATMATLVFSHGVPMVLMGDEWGRSAGGNNNGYCQDNEINWLDWPDGDEVPDQDFAEFVRALIALRQSRPLLSAEKFHHGQPVPTAPDVPNVRWLRSDGEEMGGEDWQNGQSRAVAMMLNGPGQRSLLLLFNASAEELSFVLPGRNGPVRWGVLVDTATGAFAPDWERVEAGAELLVADRAVCVLESEEALP
ncbi:MAG TPA: glycogen debranching protein GlgX [Thermohalobaculum sp.]|nr:glycogen debranching protein GlgX [Thermohalobaculum sp.]